MEQQHEHQPAAGHGGHSKRRRHKQGHGSEASADQVGHRAAEGGGRGQHPAGKRRGAGQSGPDDGEHQPQGHHPQGQQAVAGKINQPRQRPAGVQPAARRGQQQGGRTTGRRQPQPGEDGQRQPDQQAALAQHHHQRPVNIEREGHQQVLRRACHTRSAVSCTTLMVRALNPASQ